MAQEQLGISSIREEIRFQEVSWILERVAWVVLALVPLAALTGIFAHGTISEASGKISIIPREKPPRPRRKAAAKTSG
jgi:hypothetical protein